MPSSKNRRRVEVPNYMYDRLTEIATNENRTVASVIQELLFSSLFTYQPVWVPDKHLQRFNARARAVLDYAHEEAQAFWHDYVGTEHLLLGLLRDDAGVAAQSLTALGVTLAKVRSAVETIIGRGDAPSQGKLDYVPRARKVLGLALDEAQRLDSSAVRTEHILLAIIRDGGGVAANILDDLGVLGKLHAEIIERLGQHPSA